MSPAYHPRAYLTGIKNVSRGLASRTKIIMALEQGKIGVADISEKSKLGQSCVGYHLRLMLKQKVVTMRQTGRTGRWTLTVSGQKRLFT